MYKIGEFSIINKISKRMLRYYDEKDLLKPKKDEKNGYRYYTNDDIKTINRIKLLRKYNFSTDEIKNIFKMNSKDIKIAFQNKINELNEKSIEYSDVVEELKNYIECTQTKNIMNTYDVFLGVKKPLYALCLRRVVDEDEIELLVDELTNLISKINPMLNGKYFAIFHSIGESDLVSYDVGTWLQWPHNFTYGEGYKEKVEPIWIEMASALSQGEKVHIVAYDESEKERIHNALADKGVNMDKINFYIYPTDDVWARDNGPIFAYDKDNNLKILDFGFNGWGKKTPFAKDALLRERLSKDLGIERIDLHNLVLEGGAIELDGNGTCLATRSAVTNKNRNPNLSKAEIEKYIKENLGATNFIWLDGVSGADITDFHIDGFAKFYDKSTIITLSENDLAEWGVSDKDIKTLMNAKNATGETYKYVNLPLSKNKVVLENGKDLGYKGSYANFYIGNKVVLVPNYNDPNDKVANDIIQKLYPDRKVVGIDVRELYKNGGMIHCVTQQQPVKLK